MNDPKPIASRPQTKKAPFGALFAALLLSMAAPTMANAKDVIGIINGYDCATQGLKCPADRLDPHVALERDFVVQQAAGSYILIPNVPRDVKVRHVLQRVRVTGDMDPKYDTMKVDKLAVYDKKADTFETVWSPQLEEKARQEQKERILQRDVGN